MAKFWKIKIGTVWLTSDGTETGKLCKTQMSGVDALLSPVSANTVVASDGTPFTETPLSNGKGRAFEINVQTMKADVFDDLKALITEAIETGAEINITGDGDAGDFDVDAISFFNPLPLSFGTFSNGFIKEVVLRFITTAIN